MYLCKSDKAREELTAKNRTLSQRQRATLLMADGTRTRAELRVLLQFEDEVVDGLITGRYLQAGPHPSSSGVASKTALEMIRLPLVPLTA